MSFNSPARTMLGQGQQQIARAGRIGAPMGGLNTLDSIASMQPDDCIYAYNIGPKEKGFKVRAGYKENATSIGSGPCRTLIPFNSDDPTEDKLFVATNQGIFDITAGGAIGAALLAFGTTTGNAGWGMWTHYINDAAARTLFYADEVNGLYEYTVGGGWAQTTAITGVAESDIVFVAVHKLRLWLVDRDGEAWYLPVGAKAGAATKFILGSKYKAGGQTVGIYTWTMDGGDGIDDYLIAISRAGDVLAYKGEDPGSLATWSSVGRWFCGAIPIGRRVAASIGGGLHVLSVYGLVDIGQLLSGTWSVNDEVDRTDSRKISPAIRLDLQSRMDLYGWDIVPLSSESALAIVRPVDDASVDLQYVRYSGKAAWTFWRGIPANCMVEWHGEIYIGDTNSVVHKMTGGEDGVALLGTTGEPVPFSFLTAFQDLDAPNVNKQVHLIRPIFLSENGEAPRNSTTVRYDYNFREIASVPFTPSLGSPSKWDSGKWDDAIWSGGTTMTDRVYGAQGLGRMVALACRGLTSNQATFLESGITWSTGGPL